MKILCNKIRCKHCGDVIESRTPHEFVTCSCRAVAVDGGHDYLRRVFKTKIEDDYEELSLTTPTGKPVGFSLSSFACNRTPFAGFGIQV